MPLPCLAHACENERWRQVRDAWLKLGNGGVVWCGAGNGQLAGDSISCQHGEKECEGNTILACMQVLFRSLAARQGCVGKRELGGSMVVFMGLEQLQVQGGGFGVLCRLPHRAWHRRALMIALSLACYLHTLVNVVCAHVRSPASGCLLCVCLRGHRSSTPSPRIRRASCRRSCAWRRRTASPRTTSPSARHSTISTKPR